MTTARKSAPPPTTVAEFLDWPGDGTAKRYQLFDGEVHAMAPASGTQSLIQAELTSLIRNRLVETGRRCRALTEPAVVPHVQADTNLRVPDIGVICAPLKEGQIVIPDPVLLVEILSPGNKADTWANVWAYTTIPSVQEILVVDSTRIGAALLRRQADLLWPKNAQQIDRDGTVRLESIDLTFLLAELYAGSHLA